MKALAFIGECLAEAWRNVYPIYLGLAMFSVYGVKQLVVKKKLTIR